MKSLRRSYWSPGFASIFVVGIGFGAFGGCASEDAPEGEGKGGSSSGAGASAGTAAGGKAGASGSAGVGTAGSAAGTLGAAGSSGASAAGAGGVATGGVGPLGGTAGSAGSSLGGSAAGGVSAGGVSAGGSAGSLGGSSAGGDAPGGSSAGGGAGASAGGTGGGASEPCPANAVFCSGFDDAELPEGAVFKLNGDPATPWTQYFEVDATVKNRGNSSLRTKSEINGYRMLSVPTGGATFWVRLYIRSDKDLGEIDHNVFVQAAKTDEPNDGEHMEFGEDVGMSWHFDDSNIRWPEGYGRLSGGGTMPYTLAKDTWHCLELLFDGAGRVHQAYVNGTLLIDAQNFPAAAQQWSQFKFGYNALHGTVRNTWYDDVAVAPTRVGCL